MISVLPDIPQWLSIVFFFFSWTVVWIKLYKKLGMELFYRKKLCFFTNLDWSLQQIDFYDGYSNTVPSV